MIAMCCDKCSARWVAPSVGALYGSGIVSYRFRSEALECPRCGRQGIVDSEVLDRHRAPKLRALGEIPARGTGGQDRSKPPRPEPSTLSPAEALSLIVACLSGDHRKAGQGCGQDECWLCCAEATARDALAAFPAAPVGEGSRQEVDLG